MASSEKGSWIDRDRDILQRQCELVFFHIDRNSLLSLRWLGLVQSCDFVYLWFGSLYTLPILLWARLLGKRIFLVSGGFDVAKACEVGHGAFCQSAPSRWLRSLIFTIPEKIFCVSKSNQQETIRNAKVPAGKTYLIPHGFEPLPESFHLLPWTSRKNQVVMVSSVPSHYATIKGWDQFVSLAQDLSDIEFVHIGTLAPELNSNLPANLSLKGYVSFRSPEFLQLLNESKVVVQMSYYESFAASVVDAALCGCFPVVSNQYALPELVENKGLALPYGDRSLWANKVREILSKTQDPNEIQEHFLQRYHVGLRAEKLLKQFFDQSNRQDL